MQGLLKKTIAITKANSSKFHSHRFSTLSSFGTFAAATDNVAPPPQLPPFDYEPQPYKGPLADEVFAKRKKFLGPSLFHYCQKLLNIVEGKMQYLFDESGRRYLDAFARIVTVSCGHCHPEVLNAILEQSKLLRHATTIYLHHAIADFAEALASKMAVNLKVVSFVNSGSEANELAMLMARLYTGNLGMISLRNAYHGGSSSTIGLTALNTWKYPIPEGEIHHVVNPDPYHGIFGRDAKSYAKDVEDHINYGSSGKVAGFIAETIHGVGGAVELAPGYLKLVYDNVHKAGGVCIADEVQTGFGSTGSHYWGFETQGVVPDIVTKAKFHFMMVSQAEEGELQGKQEILEEYEEEGRALQLSLNSIIGMTPKKSLKLWGEIKQKKVIVLIDCGASNNIIANRVVEELKLPIIDTPEYSVEVVDGHKVTSKGICKGILLQLQGVQIEQDFSLLDLREEDVVLGLDWLGGLGEIRLNFKDLTLKIDREGQTVTFKGEPSLSEPPTTLKAQLIILAKGLLAIYWDKFIKKIIY